jgi:hypothetical protein
MTIAKEESGDEESRCGGEGGAEKICNLSSQVEDGLKRHGNCRGGNKHERELTHIYEIEQMDDNGLKRHDNDDGYLVASDSGEGDPSVIAIHYKNLVEEHPAMASSWKTKHISCTT